MIVPALVLAGIACAVTAAIAARLALPGSGLWIVDHPNERSLHVAPTPRTGGVAIFAGVTTAMIGAALGRLVWPEWIPPVPVALWLILGLTTIVAMFSLLDDRAGLSPAARFVLQIGIASVLVLSRVALLRTIDLPGLTIDLGVLAIPASVLCVVWMANLYNFMDGIDGLAGSMTAIGFGALSVAAAVHGDEAMAMVAAIVAAAAAGFLSRNWPPAQIFMGDVGSVPLGFLAAALALYADEHRVVSVWASALAFSPFIVDATVTLARRVWRRERVWQAHRTHYYQRLVLAGWTHGRTTALACLLMLACGVSAVAYSVLGGPGRASLLAVWAIIYTTLVILVGRVERREQQERAQRETTNGLLQTSASPR